MKVFSILIMVSWSAMLVSGCSPTQGSSSLQQEIDSLKAEVETLKDTNRLADLKGEPTDPAELGQIRAQVQRLSESVDSAGSASGLSLSQQLADISARLDRLESKSGLRQPSTNAAGAPYGGATAGSYRGPDETVPAATEPQTGAGPYETGKSLFDQKQYRQAVGKFKAYLKEEPEGANAAAAQFYIGESLYAQEKYEQAILEYQKIVTDYKKSNYVATSLLKQGQAFQASGDKGSATLLYQKVVRDYPKSWAAGVAKERLKKK